MSRRMQRDSNADCCKLLAISSKSSRRKSRYACRPISCRMPPGISFAGSLWSVESSVESSTLFGEVHSLICGASWILNESQRMELSSLHSPG